MKKLFVFIALFAGVNSIAQVHELNAGLGFAGYLGDLSPRGPESFVLSSQIRPSQFHMSYSLAYRYNFRKNFSIGLNLGHMNLSASDAVNTSTTQYDASWWRLARNLSFYTAVNQAYLDIRYEPFRTPEKWASGKWLASPYIGAGLGLFAFNPKTKYNGIEVELQPLGTEGQGIVAGKPEKYSLTQLSIPLNFGLRFVEPRRKFAIGFELNYNHLFTDYLDDVSTTYVNPATITAADPTNAPLINALSNRNIAPASEAFSFSDGQQRGQPTRNDLFFTGQLKFSWFIGSAEKDAYYKCCGY